MTYKDLVNFGREHYMADVWLYPTPTADITKYFFLVTPDIASESFLTQISRKLSIAQMKLLANSDLINTSYLFMLPLM